MVNLKRENLKLAVKQCYQICQFQKDKNWWKMPKLKNSSVTFFSNNLNSWYAKNVRDFHFYGKL